MRRSLVQGDDTARHPFLQQLPRHVRHGGGLDPIRRRNRTALREAVGALREGAERKLRHWRREHRITAVDVKDFLLAYCACFVAISAFFA
ncbi:MAG: hypothetical protein JSS36_00710 [Proteobacteria bacterium]|nr:hypothetical protein [Pseudomonadota bacterium]